MNIIIVVSILLVLIIGVLLYKKMAKSPKIQVNTAATNPAAQEAYQQRKHQEEEKKLTLAERMELSWKFLYDITEIILSKFSKTDQTKVKDLGEVLAKNGMQYNHIVDLALPRARITQSRTMEIEVDRSRSDGRSI